MRGLGIILVTAAIVAGGVSAIHAKDGAAAGSWGALEFLLGEWVGEEGGIPGQGTAYMSFASELGGELLVRRHRVEYPATRKRVGTTEQDLLVIHRDESGNPTRATLFDSQHREIRFTVEASPDGKTITLTSQPESAVPRYRVSWVREGDREISFTLAMASPSKPDEFLPQTAGKAKKK